MKSMPKSRLTRAQMQAQLRQNARTLCSNCPKMTQTNGALDDSLTSLQWLWNLNVNINPPFENSKGLKAVSPERVMPESGNQAVQSHNNFNFNKQSTSACHFPECTRPSVSASATNSENLCSCNQYNSIALVNKVTCDNLTANQFSHSKESIVHTAVTVRNECPTAQQKQVLTGKHKNNRSKIHQPQQCVGPLLSDAAKPYQTTALPSSQIKLDVLPGPIDYKTNAYVRPPFSLVSLVCMALHKSKRSKMSASSIWKWIKDNFIYYRYSDTFCQKSIEQTLLKSKYFCKTQRKRKQQSNFTFWQINPCHFTNKANKQIEMHSDVSHENSAQQLQGISKSANSATMFLTVASRKRKQPSPQKRVHNQSNMQSCKCKESTQTENIDQKNLLQEQAPELGSLKGDYNWNSVFDDFFGNCDIELPPQTVSMSSKSVSTATPSNMLVGLVEDTEAHNAVVLHDNEGELNNENKFIVSGQSNELETGTWKESDVNETMFNDCSTDYANLGIGGLDGVKEVDSLLIDVGDIDLTITGRQIEPPPEWVPVSGDIDAILCEKQDDNLLNRTEDLCSTEDLSSLFGCGLNQPLFNSGMECQTKGKSDGCSTSQHQLQTSSSSQWYKHSVYTTSEDNPIYQNKLNPPKRKCLQF